MGWTMWGCLVDWWLAPLVVSAQSGWGAVGDHTECLSKSCLECLGSRHMIATTCQRETSTRRVIRDVNTTHDFYFVCRVDVLLRVCVQKRIDRVVVVERVDIDDVDFVRVDQRVHVVIVVRRVVRVVQRHVVRRRVVVRARASRVQCVREHVDRCARARRHTRVVTRRVDVVDVRNNTRHVATNARFVVVVAHVDRVVRVVVVRDDRERNTIRVHDSIRVAQRAQMTARDFRRRLQRVRDRSHVDRVRRVRRVQHDNRVKNIVARDDDLHDSFVSFRCDVYSSSTC